MSAPSHPVQAHGHAHSSHSAAGAAETKAILARCLTRGIPVDPMPPHPSPSKSPGMPHAPTRVPHLSTADFALAVKNALRYFPAHLHDELGPEFARELAEDGHIYMRRFRPTEYAMRAYPVDWYPGANAHARCIMLMVQNNLDPRVAQFPEELITYGGNGSVLSNWAQYHLLMQYLSRLTDEQTLVMYSGHPMGMFPSPRHAPRVVITNGMVVPNYSSPQDYQRMYALGVSQYGQMTAGSYCYIGPQGIVHGTTLTILNAGRKYLPRKADAHGGEAKATRKAEDEREEDTGSSLLAGKVYLSSGLGGMSGAQGKAGVICGCVTVLAEIDPAALAKRLEQGWVQERIDDLDALVARVRAARTAREVVALAFAGNIVDVWERFTEEMTRSKECLIELASDQTSLHNPFNGGYYPAGENQRMMHADPAEFKRRVQASLRRQVTAINKCVALGTRFWDYGNSFLLEAARAGADILDPSCGGHVAGPIVPSSSSSSSSSSATAAAPVALKETDFKFRYPSYVQEFMGDIFSLGFGPFRWVCCSNSPEDLAETDRIAATVIQGLLGHSGASTSGPHSASDVPEVVKEQLRDNLLWIQKAGENKLVVGSQARILYADAQGRAKIAAAFNAAIEARRLTGPVVLSRDHHDVSGTDSPFRETSNVYDGSSFCADMAVHNVIGDSFRGATWVALHNGGGVGWGEVVNGGFGLVLDGTPDAFTRSQNMLTWDVTNGIARRAWAGNDKASLALTRAQEQDARLVVTHAVHADDHKVRSYLPASVLASDVHGDGVVGAGKNKTAPTAAANGSSGKRVHTK